ncbi:GcrA family cell cycle regulator [Mesorhizobium sp.]|uniref:GcrA family cell cycle regulator n=1 Tax=Mesorhizobium sp. TaxID=1871066 RepID=UPI00120254DD|nr:GcrA family cell cycle regulator [Mesorhizobium sp.]TIN76747.1 MAG: GcrA cell cycle regulator [Mesorhizobium sp.]
MSDLPDWKGIDPAERDRQLAQFCQEGLTARAIANKFVNCSRSAVIGRVHRLKLQLNNGAPRKGKVGRRPAAETAPKPPKVPAARRVSKLVQQTSSWRGANNPPATDFKARAERRAASPGLPAHLVAGEARRPIEAAVPISLNLKLVDLTEHTCKWPVGDPQAADFGFCGNGAAETGPYCKYHARIAYTPPIYRLSVPKGA